MFLSDARPNRRNHDFWYSTIKSSSKLATPVHDWSEEELCFFNVSFNRISECREFFGIDDLPDTAPCIMAQN